MVVVSRLEPLIYATIHNLFYFTQLHPTAKAKGMFCCRRPAFAFLDEGRNVGERIGHLNISKKQCSAVGRPSLCWGRGQNRAFREK